MMKIMLYVLVVCIYFGISQNVEYDSIEVVLMRTPTMAYWASIRLILARQSLLSLQEFVTRNNSTWMDFDETEVGFRVNQLEYLERSLVFGNDALDIQVYQDKDQDHVMLSDGCFYEDESEKPPDCDLVFDGVMKNGLHGAISEYVDEIRHYVQQANTSTFNPSSTFLVSKLFNETGFQFLTSMDKTYLQGALNQSLRHYMNASTDLLDQSETIRTIVLVLFSAFSLLLYVVFYRPLISRLDNEIKNTRSMLLLIPSHVVDKIPMIRKFIINVTESF
eukprot:TRINITY_DN1641_c0_g1_i7.p1 TRINITY_DN1641_c0_g1~~TRINITY_DN1641_c0_g1_i7.p1  ORF type:complete len:277 (-),score=33.79 TRINITY_DN1641_c0_g1_i7:390-1220(-)